MKKYIFTMEDNTKVIKLGKTIFHATNRLITERMDNGQPFVIDKITDEKDNVYEVTKYTEFKQSSF